jgi:hypothetical protein
MNQDSRSQEPELEDQDDDGNDCEKESQPPASAPPDGLGISFGRAKRITHSSPPIVLEPSFEFILKSSRVLPVGCSWLLNPGS